MASLTELTAIIPTHSAVVNAFYDDWESRCFSIAELKVFVRNYGAFIEAFPAALARLIVGTENVSARTEYAKTLFSEMGYGRADKAHSVLFYSFSNDLAEKMQYPGELSRSLLAQEINLLPTTVNFINGEQRLYSSAITIAAGAQLALEWQAYTMLQRLYEGARNYKYLWTNADGFHESCEYFYAHIGEAEKEHKEESLRAAIEYDTNPIAHEEIEHGFHEHITLISEFWRGLHISIKQ